MPSSEALSEARAKPGTIFIILLIAESEGLMRYGSLAAGTSLIRTLCIVPPARDQRNTGLAYPLSPISLVA